MASFCPVGRNTQHGCRLVGTVSVMKLFCFIGRLLSRLSRPNTAGLPFFTYVRLRKDFVCCPIWMKTGL